MYELSSQTGKIQLSDQTIFDGLVMAAQKECWRVALLALDELVARENRTLIRQFADEGHPVKLGTRFAAALADCLADT